MYTLYLAVAAVLGALVELFVWGGPFAATLLKWLLAVQVGLGGVWAFLGHYFKSDMVAEYIGWPKGNLFQKEVAFANLGLGVCGLVSFFIHGGFQLATILFTSVFLVGAFTVHVADQRASGNAQPGNAGPVFYADIIMPALLFLLYLFQ